MDVKTIEKLVNSKKCVALALDVVVTKAAAEVIREKVDGYILPLFETFDFRVTKETRADKLGEKITNPDHLYLDTDEAKVTAFYVACHEAHLANGFDKLLKGREVGYCPALIHETKHRKAKQALAKFCAEKLGVPGFSEYPHSEKLVDLICGAVAATGKLAA